MRTNKFRIWNEEKKSMLYFDLWAASQVIKDLLLTYKISKEEMDKMMDTVGQFTGLNDKNGREIYEGDVVKYKFTLLGGVDEVIFRDGKFELKNDYVNEVGYRTVKNVSEYCEVIGNIYENPELR